MCQGLAEEGACDAYPRVRTASAKQVRLEFRADARRRDLGCFGSNGPR